MQLKFFQFIFSFFNKFASGVAASWAVSLFYSPRRFLAANWEKLALREGRMAELRFDGESLDATVWDGDGPTVLLVHGWEGRRGQLGKIALALKKQSFRVVAFDGPAHGSSLKKKTTLVQFSQAVQAASSQFGPLHAIVGHSFGSAATAIAVRQGVETERIVLISCPYSLRHVVSGFAQLVGVPERTHEKMYPIMQALHACPEIELSFEKIGPDIKIPCLLVHDMKDRYIPATDAKAVNNKIVNSTLIETNGLGHMRILQDPKVVKHVVEFIALHSTQLSQASK